MNTRRSILTGLGALLAAPAVITTPGLLMPVRSIWRSPLEPGDLLMVLGPIDSIIGDETLRYKNSFFLSRSLDGSRSSMFLTFDDPFVKQLPYHVQQVMKTARSSDLIDLNKAARREPYMAGYGVSPKHSQRVSA